MAVTTYWVRADGNGSDLAAGTSYDTAFATIKKGLTELDDTAATKGSILNIVNDGTHVWSTVGNEVNINNGVGTNFTTDPGYTIQGVDSSGNAAMATIASTGADGARRIMFMRDGSGYNIIQNLIFDATGTSTDSNRYSVVKARDNGTKPVLIRYCAILGADTGSVSSGVRALFEIDTTGSSTETFRIEYCYFQNCANPIYSITGYGGGLLKTKIDHCVGIWDANGRGEAWYNQPLWTTSVSNVVTFTNNTFYESVGNNNTEPIFKYTPSNSLSIGTCEVYSNLVWQDTEATLEAFMATEATRTGITHSGFIGANVLLGGTNVASSDLTSAGWYEQCWDHDNDDTTGYDPYPGDTQAFGVADTTVFNDPDTTYAWVLPNNLTITILKDLRPIKYETGGRFGSVPGALASAATATEDPDDVTDPNDAASVPYIDVLPLIGDDLQYSATIRLGATQNRATHYYDRIDRENIRWAEYSAHTLELATNTTTRVTLGGIETGEIMLLESTTGIQVSINATNMFFPSSKMVAVKSSFDSVLVKNPSTTSSATITMAVVD